VVKLATLHVADLLQEALHHESQNHKRDKEVGDQRELLLGVFLASNQMTDPCEPVVQPTNHCGWNGPSNANDAAYSENAHR
jgi:hypothetical protein